jgi:cytochrome c biogenesis protein CcmG, thiol:disulfide interchange protein DsbE
MTRRLPTRLVLVLLLAFTAVSAKAEGLNFKLKSLEGQGKVELAREVKKNPVLVSFWATWCHPCQEELVHIQKLYEAYADSGISFFAISIDDAKTAGKVRSVAKGKRITIPILLDPEQQAMQAFGLFNVPGVFIIGGEGQKLYEHTGYKPGDEAALEENLRRVLKLAPKSITAPAAGDTTACGADSSGCPAKENK